MTKPNADGEFEDDYSSISEYKIAVHSEIFALFYQCNGGVTWSEAYGMPIYLRRFYLKKLQEVKEREQREIEKNQQKASSGGGTTPIIPAGVPLPGK